MQTLTLRTPDDFHIHLRDGAFLARTVADVAKQCDRALVMPNLVPAVDSIEALCAYRERILAHIPAGQNFLPLLTLYLSPNLTVETIIRAREAGVIAVKWYPKGATTNSAQGVGQISALYPVLEKMQEIGLPLLIHGEVTDPEIDIFDREAVFIEKTLIPLRAQFPELKIVMEHITTENAVQYVQSASHNLAATITAQHLLFNRNQLLVGGVKPHYYCLPILKTEHDRKALLSAATSGDARFFLGTDSAPHERQTKENACGCAGCYTSPYMLEYYAQAFESVGKLDRLEDFASRFGAQFYGLARNASVVSLERVEQEIESALPYGDGEVVPLQLGQPLHWRFVGKLPLL
ncbi:MAG: dihydroorotase [Cardiobacteriaceae bacterium]|nr:dihydroorotase [Cardiobacteriaceae bacterium]